MNGYDAQRSMRSFGCRPFITLSRIAALAASSSSSSSCWDSLVFARPFDDQEMALEGARGVRYRGPRPSEVATVVPQRWTTCLAESLATQLNMRRQAESRCQVTERNGKKS